MEIPTTAHVAAVHGADSIVRLWPLKLIWSGSAASLRPVITTRHENSS